MLDTLKINAYENLGYLTPDEASEKIAEIQENRTIGHISREEFVSNCCGARVLNGHCEDCKEHAVEVEAE